MSCTMCEVYVAADGTEIASDGNVDRVQHPSTGVYNRLLQYDWKQKRRFTFK